MKILLVGSGGREHALAWKIAQSPKLTQLYVAPGNGGTFGMEKTENVDIAATDLDSLCEFAQATQIDLAVIGPEDPLAAGIVDRLTEIGIRTFGPSKAAAQLEGSKAFAKAFMARHAIPTAESETFDSFDDAVRYLRFLEKPPVIKASGLAAGKGVLLPETREEAAKFLQQILLDNRFGDAGTEVVLEERLYGRELSVLAFCDGTDLAIMPPAQDHKRLLEGDHGPNTGGMGAYTPSPLVTPELLQAVETRVLRPVLDGCAAEGMPYKGVLYAGIMQTEDGIKVLEFNCRFGDPETQVVVPLMQNDIIDTFEACIDGTLAATQPQWSKDAAVTIVMSAQGYPGEYTKGVEIDGIADAEELDCLVFHAGTKPQEAGKYRDSRLLTNGGRILAVTALGKKLGAARHLSYMGVHKIKFNESYFRRDIGEDG